VRRVEALREEGLCQAEALIRRHFGLSPEEMARLDDEKFCELAAQAYFFEERRALAVKRGVLMALAELAERAK
jgi:hypothetical protein